MSGYSDAGQEPFSIALNYLGSRDGKDHYLLELMVEQTLVVEQALMRAQTTIANFATPRAQSDWRSSDPQDPFTEVKTITYADGSTEVTRTRRVSYELVYDGEPFYLKLADRVLLCFGGYGIERYTAEELAAMLGKRSSELYRPCPNCALSDAMGVDEVRVEVGAFAAF